MKKVVLGIVEKDDEYLIIKRKKIEGDLVRAFPGGGMEISDITEERCITREVDEEGSIKCIPVQYFGSRLVANNTIEISYRLCKYLSGEPAITRPLEIEEVKRAKKNELLELFTTPLFGPVKEYLNI